MNGIKIIISRLPALPQYVEKYNTLFQCSKCGKCCNNFSALRLIESDFIELGHGLKLPVYQVKSKYAIKYAGDYYIKQPCPFYRENVGCTIYEHRPANCKLFPLRLTTCTDDINHIAVNLFCENASDILAQLELEIDNYIPAPKINEAN